MRFAFWQRTRQPSPGAEAYAFNYGFYLPPAASTGNIYYRPIYPLSLAPQVVVSAGVTVAGYGGLAAGQLYRQGLIDPNAGQPTQLT